MTLSNVLYREMTSNWSMLYYENCWGCSPTLRMPHAIMCCFHIDFVKWANHPEYRAYQLIRSNIRISVHVAHIYFELHCLLFHLWIDTKNILNHMAKYFCISQNMEHRELTNLITKNMVKCHYNINHGCTSLFNVSQGVNDG